MARDTYATDLARLKASVESMGRTVETRLQDAVTAVREDDETLARLVAEHDDDVDETYLAVESDCIDLLALQQPVASDLRLVVACFKIVTDLERIADLAANLARYTLAARASPLPNEPISDVSDMALGQLRGALAAFADGDADRCRTVAIDDVDLDQRCRAATGDLVRYLVRVDATGDERDRIEADTKRYLLTIRDLERAGDHAVNVAARTLYVIENDDALVY